MALRKKPYSQTPVNLTNRCCVAVFLFIDRSQTTPKCGKKKLFEQAVTFSLSLIGVDS